MAAIDILTGTGVLNAVPTTRILTIGGVSYDLSQDRTWAGGGGGSGTVTSVNMSVPTGFAISGNPITSSGTLALAFASGYALPTTIKQSNWDDAYTFVSAFPSQTGNSGKFLTTNGSTLSWGTVSASIADGDKGDITVSGSGATWTIDSTAVTYAKIQNVAANSFLANVTGSAASVQAIATNRIPLFASAITGTPSGTTFLRGDGSWATPTATATPGGANGEIQYNNAGAFAGAANVEIDAGDLVLIDAGFPTAPSAGKTKIFTDGMAGRRLVSSIDPDGIHFDFQPALFNSTTYMWLAGTGTTLAINWGTSFTARNNGTGAAQATPAKTSSSAITSMNRATYSTGSTATGASGIQSSETNAWIGNASNLGGFFFYARVALEAFSGTYRFFVGVSANNATMAADSSTWNNTIGFGKDAGDTTLQFIMRNNGTVTTKNNTTITPNSTDIYDLYIYVRPNGTQVDFELRNAVTNAVLATRTETTNLPLNTTFMYMQSQIQSTVGTTPKLLALNRMYLESNL